jgi:phenylalanyl-tRNA synthetase alpha chain
MWLYYLQDSKVRQKLAERGWVGELCYGKVYRKDEIDSKHFPVFHQIDGLYLRERSRGDIALSDLEKVLADIVKSVFGEDIVYRFLDDSFPFTDPSTQVEIQWNDAWLEVVGAGIVHGAVLKNLGLNPEEYSGWAFGFGLERLSMIRNAIPDIRIFWSEDPRITKQFASIESQFHEVSKYPPVVRDISFVVSKNTSPNRFYEIVRHFGGGLVEEVGLTDEYEDAAKFGANTKSYTFRIVYRSHERTLTNSEVNEMHSKIEQLVASELGARIR